MLPSKIWACAKIQDPPPTRVSLSAKLKGPSKKKSLYMILYGHLFVLPCLLIIHLLLSFQHDVSMTLPQHCGHFNPFFTGSWRLQVTLHLRGTPRNRGLRRKAPPSRCEKDSRSQARLQAPNASSKLQTRTFQSVPCLDGGASRMKWWGAIQNDLMGESCYLASNRTSAFAPQLSVWLCQVLVHSYNDYNVSLGDYGCLPLGVR